MSNNERGVCNCIVGKRPDHEAIDAALAAGKPVRWVEKTFGVAKSTAALHKARCLTGMLTEAMARRHSDALLDQLDYLVSTSLDVVTRAQAKRKDVLTLKAIGTCCDVLKLKAALTGMKPEAAPRVSYSIVFDRGRPVAVENSDERTAGELGPAPTIVVESEATGEGEGEGDE